MVVFGGNFNHMLLLIYLKIFFYYYYLFGVLNQ